jgi:hypothetical protein
MWMLKSLLTMVCRGFVVVNDNVIPVRYQHDMQIEKHEKIVPKIV